MGITFDGESKGPMTHQTKFAVNFREHSTYHVFFFSKIWKSGRTTLNKSRNDLNIVWKITSSLDCIWTSHIFFLFADNMRLNISEIMKTLTVWYVVLNKIADLCHPYGLHSHQEFTQVKQWHLDYSSWTICEDRRHWMIYDEDAKPWFLSNLAANIPFDFHLPQLVQ